MKNKLIVALDVNSFGKAKKLIDKLSPYINVFKVGSELFVSSGQKIIKYLRKKRKKVFLDLKFYDIPNTVEKAVLAASKKGIFMLTVHASGGFEMLKKATSLNKSNKKRPLLISVTVLTSKNVKNTKTKVLKLAKLAKKAGLDGIVSSPRETKSVKKALGRKFLVINPGVRPSWAKKDDQKRITTPKEAVANGADFIVVGRPITKAKNPIIAIKKILMEIK